MNPWPLHRGIAVVVLALVPSCTPSHVPAASGGVDANVRGTPLILDASAGERRVRRPGAGQVRALTTPFIIKVDRRNGASQDLVMGTEDIAPGQAIPPHRHLLADEIVFIHRGSGVVELGDQKREVVEGATVYIPRNVRITLRNTGASPMSIVFTFSKPGFEELMRENSVLEGQSVIALSDSERVATRARHKWHTVYDQP
jgi:quercetin dioxygenase-like cupin family protein